MEGSVRYAGDRVRVTAQLIEAATGTHLWTETYDRDLEDIFAIQSDIATRIAAALKAELVPMERECIERQPTSSPEAYALYLRVMALLQEHGLGIGGSPELRSTALAFLDRAVEIDPDFAAAYVERARVNIYRLNFDPGTAENYRSQRQELEGIVLEDLDKALALDPSMGAAHMALALTHQYNWRLTATREAYARALELSPNDPDVLSNYSTFSAYTGEHEKAIQLGRRAVTLDPNSAPIYNFLSLAYAVAGKLDDAIEASHRAVDLAPNSGLWSMVLSRLEIARGEDTKALERVRLTEHLLQYQTNPTFLGEATWAYGQLGHREDAMRAFHQLEEIAKTRRVPPATWVLAYTGLGDDDEALRRLTILADNPESYEAYFALLNIKANTYSVALFEEPRFRAVRERLGHHD
jgi:Tfp pilus assembly protein PilF